MYLMQMRDDHCRTMFYFYNRTCYVDMRSLKLIAFKSVSISLSKNFHCCVWNFRHDN